MLFGSAVKSKTSPADIDVCMVVNSTKDEALRFSEELQKELGTDFHVSYLLLNNFFANPEPIWLSLIHEGESIITGRRLSELLFSESRILFKYETSRLPYTDKIRFYYALKGRDGKNGIIKSTNSEFLAKTIILVPVRFDNDVQSFFREWNVPFTRQRLFMQKY